MGKHVALLRGINVGGKNVLPMKKLVALFEKAGDRARERRHAKPLAEEHRATSRSSRTPRPRNRSRRSMRTICNWRTVLELIEMSS